MADESRPVPPKSPLQSPSATKKDVVTVGSNASPPLLVEITPNTPAAEALAANSSVRVSKLHKVARSTRLQASVRLIKSSARSVVGQPGHNSDRRGSPDFCPPNVSGVKRSGGQVAVRPIEEESEGDDDDDQEQQQQQQQQQLSPVPVTHAALPSAIAAACRAGEELERQRMTRSAEGNPSDIHLLPAVQLTPRLRRHSSDGMLQEGKVQFPERRMSLVNSAMQSLMLQDEKNFHEGTFLDNKHQPVQNQCDETNPNEVSDASSLPPPPFTIEATTSSNLETSTPQPTLTDSSKKKSRRALQFTLKSPFDETDEHPFHFHGPRSVRHWINKRRQHHTSDNLRSYVKGKVIDRQHELFIMSIAIMLGMRTSIGRTNMQMAETEHDERRWLDNDDLMSVEKYIFPPKGSEITPPHQLNHTFKFKDYSPHAFAYLRRMFGVNEYEFLLSVCGNANYIEFQSNAKSGQFFFYSKDGKYMIKTMTNAESKFLRRITPHYFRHCALNPNTLITKFLGMYRVKLYHLRRTVKFVVMKSVYDTDKHLHQVFDVKGSSTGRDAKPGEAVKKDNDVRRALPDGAFVFESNLCGRLRAQVERDCRWLKSMKIMDYSMLIGVHHIAHRANSKRMSTPSRPKAKALDTENGGTTQLIFQNAVEDGEELSHASMDASCMTLDHYLADDDDDSYLEGSSHKRSKSHLVYEISPSDDDRASVRVVRSADVVSDVESKRESEEYAEKAIEDMYWPFHRYYDLQGRRRLKPIEDGLIAEENKCRYDNDTNELQPTNKTKYFKLLSSSSAPSSFGNVPHYQIPTFETPLSERKDGGFTMDLTDIDTPLQLTVPGAPHLVEYCDGKIFYMGIIDILQQFNIRKRLEARWRRLGGKGWEAASCVHPTIYADRFLRFFDEYTRKPPGPVDNGGA